MAEFGEKSGEKSYQVLARKYRPATFADLVGQEAMVRTLKNAFAAGRIAHAFMMTGIRGTGKTTTARIIAKGLNCVGPDGNGGPTTQPCGLCGPCIAIAEGRHVDVLEMDAASHTGVNDMREVIDSVHYRAASARYKIYIIDEVHMLSNAAFNALLKTLEEPPAHVKFIFATTEIRKVPVTVLSRCQRFDLKRIEPEVQMALMRKIADAEGAKITDSALALIARAAEGSARDATSLLDQAISNGAGETSAENVRAMLGLADRGRILDLFDLILRGDAKGALDELSGQYADGADPMAVLRDLADISHWLSVIKISPEAADDPTTPPDERVRGLAMAQAVPMRALARSWQMLLKALEEVALAPNAMMAAEMAVIRLTHVADLPDPETLVKRLQSGTGPVAPAGGVAGSNAGGAPAGSNAGGAPAGNNAGGAPAGNNAGGAPAGKNAGGAPAGGLTVHSPMQRLAPNAPPRGASLAPSAMAELDASGEISLLTFGQVLDLIRTKRDMVLMTEVENDLRLVRYAPGRIEFEPMPHAKPDLAARLSQRLQGWTGQRWGVSVVSAGGAPTVAQTRSAEDTAAKIEAMDNPLVRAVMAAFPLGKISSIRAAEIADEIGEINDEGTEVIGEDWDPFEDD